MAYDDLLVKVNGNKYLLRIFLIFFFNAFPNSFITTAIAMMLYLPHDFHCIPSLEHIKNETETEFLFDDSIAIDKSQCFYNITDGLNQVNTFACENHTFSNPFGKTTASMEFDWTCGKSGYKSLIFIMFFSGKFIGAFTGIAADKFGRKPIFNISTYIMFLLMFGQSFTSATWQFAIFAFLSSGCSYLNYITGFTLCMECTTPKHRNLISISSFCSFALGFAVTSLIAFITPSWRWYYRICSMFGLLFLANHWLVPESPRWLMASGKVEEAKRYFKQMAEINNSSGFSDDILIHIEKEAEHLAAENEFQGVGAKDNGILKTFKEICAVPRMLSILAVSSLSWISVGFVYFGISFNLQALSGNLFINNALVGLVEIPGLLVMFFLVAKFNRPLASGVMTIICGMFCLMAAFLETVNPTLSTIAGFIGKSLNSGVFYIVFLHTAEIFPTVIRNSCSSIISVVGQIGPVISPSIIHLGDLYGMFIPFLVMSLTAFISGIATLLVLPNTRNVALPEVIEDTLKMDTVISSCIKKRRSERRGLQPNEQNTERKESVQSTNMDQDSAEAECYI